MVRSIQLLGGLREYRNPQTIKFSVREVCWIRMIRSSFYQVRSKSNVNSTTSCALIRWFHNRWLSVRLSVMFGADNTLHEIINAMRGILPPSH